MTATKVGPNAQHGIATFKHTGCKCVTCMMSNRFADRRRRRAKYAKREVQPGWRPCVFCGVFFSPKGLGLHETTCA